MSIVQLSPSPDGTREEPTASPRVRILVIQLSRLGDTLQSLMALRAAQQLYPQLEIHFVAREKFADAARNTEWIDQVHALPTGTLVEPVLKFLKENPVDPQHIDYRSVIGNAASWIAPLVDQPWQLVFNWTYSDTSSWLTGILPSVAKFGFTRKVDLNAATPDGWSHYIQAVVQQQSPQNIHLTDILTTQLLTALQLHVGDPENEANSRESLATKFFNLPKDCLETIREEGRHWKDPSRKWISFQLGAGHPAKSWNRESWARLACRILARHSDCNLILLGGGEADRATASLILDELRHNGLEDRSVLSLIDQTDFPLWASIIGRSQWVFSGDTSVVHLASVLGTRVVNISVGPVRYQETGPYGNGHLVLQPDVTCSVCAGVTQESEHSCRNAITPELVYATWSYGASEWAHRREISFEEHLEHLGLSGVDATARVFRSRIRLTDEGGGVSYEPIQKTRKLRFEDWSARVTGHVARAWYCGWTPQVAIETDRNLLSSELLRDLRKVSESVDVLLKISEEGRRTSQQIQREAMRTKSSKVMRIEDKTRIQELALKLSEIDKLLERLVRAQPCLSPFLSIQRVMMHNLVGNEVDELGKQSSLVWDQLVTGSRIWREWIEATLSLTRPRAVKGNFHEKRPDGIQV